MASALNVALPIIGKTFSIDAVSLGWVATAYTLAIAICLVPFGRAADIHGRMRVFTIGVFGFLITSLLCCFATSGTMLIAFRAPPGIGAAMMFATSSALLSSAYPPQERGRVLGIDVASVYMGLSLGPFVGGILTQNFGWRSIFVVGAAWAFWRPWSRCKTRWTGPRRAGSVSTGSGRRSTGQPSRP